MSAASVDKHARCTCSMRDTGKPSHAMNNPDEDCHSRVTNRETEALGMATLLLRSLIGELGLGFRSRTNRQVLGSLCFPEFYLPSNLHSPIRH